MGSKGPAGTFAHVERAALARFLEDVVRGREMACITSLSRGFFRGEWWCRRESRLYPFLFAVSVGSGAVVRRRTCQADGGSDEFRQGRQLVAVGKRKKKFGPVHGLSTYFDSQNCAFPVESPRPTNGSIALRFRFFGAIFPGRLRPGSSDFYP